MTDLERLNYAIIYYELIGAWFMAHQIRTIVSDYYQTNQDAA